MSEHIRKRLNVHSGLRGSSFKCVMNGAALMRLEHRGHSRMGKVWKVSVWLNSP